MTDLSQKYQKLATEYSKLRAQVPILKKAVIDEQAKGNELQESVKGKDQMIRKYEQEVDSLSFRNQQLSARVALLQNELDSSNARNKKNKKNSPDDAVSNAVGAGVFNEELMSKIEENARLHKQVYEADLEHQQIVHQLQDRLAELESQANQHQQVLSAAQASNQSQLSRLQEEKALLEVRLQRQDKDSKDAVNRASNAEQRLQEVQEDLTFQLSEANRTIAEKLPFNDTKHKHLNALNIPPHDRKHQLRAKELVGQAATLVKELIQGLSNFHTYCEQRARIYPNDADREPMSDVNKKLCQCLHENASYLRPIDRAFREFQESMVEDSLTTLETAVQLQDFSSRFKKYVVYANKLTPYFLLSIEAECSVSSCTATLAMKNMELHASLKQFMSAFSKLDTYITLLAAQSGASCTHPKSSHAKMFQLLSRAVTDFHEATKEVSKHYNAKVSLEHQLPTATQKLKTTDECVVSSLISLVTCTGKFSAFVSGNLDFLCKTSCHHTRGESSAGKDGQGQRSHPSVNEFRQQAANYLSTINGQPVPESVPYATAVHNRKTLYSSTESRESLSQQVSSFQERISRLEQDKEHWMLESQLLQMKLEKEQQRVGKLEKQMQMHQNQMTGSIEDNIDLTQEKLKAVNFTNPTQTTKGNTTSLLGKLESVADDSDSMTREQLIKNHFSSRINELTLKLQVADGKALNFQAECRALHKRLDLSERQKSKLQQDLAAASQTITQLKDELQTTTKSYEGQLSMMSEHLAAMNEKLTNQKEEIDILKYQMQNVKSSKKGRGK